MRTLTLLFFTASLAFAQQRPDFSGAWELNVTKSSFDKQPAPKHLSFVIEHKDPRLTQFVSHGEPEGQKMPPLVYVTDGTEGSNTVMGNPLKYTAKWGGAALTVITWGNFGQNAMKLTDQWSLGDEGKTLVILRHYEGQGGPQDQKLVLDRKPAK